MAPKKQNPLHQFKQHLFFKYLIKYEKLRHRFILKEVQLLTKDLADTIFPALQARNRVECLCHLGESQLVIHDMPIEHTLPECPRLIRFLDKAGIKTLNFDSRLEQNQLIEAASVLIYAAKHLKDADGKSAPLYITNSESLAQSIVSENGLQRFCARIQFKREQEAFIVTYSYCELFYTYSLKQALQKFGKPLNHRSLFSFAPWAGVSAFLLLFFHIWFWGSESATETAAGLFASGILGITVAYFFQTLASAVYDREHQEMLLQERIQEITALSHFPTHNPNPVLKTDKAGNVLFHNPAAEQLLSKVEMDVDSPELLLPDDALQVIQRCLTSHSTFDVEGSRFGRELRYSVSAFPNEEAVFWAITDITRLKKLEHALRDFNQSLEIKVQERTQELEATRDVTILSLSSLAETRDPDTGAHLNRTRRYVKALAERLRHHPNFAHELDDNRVIDLLYRSAPLHDIGKVGIPDSILLKPGPLTTAEFELMKSHPKLGGDSLKLAEKELGSNAFLRYAWEIAYYHHEKWDGSGYPFGLTGADIPISGRLMALADVYDALISKRVYKEAFSHETSKAIILEGKGSHFDPDVVDAFLAEETTFIEIAKQFAE